MEEVATMMDALQELSHTHSCSYVVPREKEKSIREEGIAEGWNYLNDCICIRRTTAGGTLDT